jgi:hypothetical protein
MPDPAAFRPVFGLSPQDKGRDFRSTAIDSDPREALPDA